MNNVMRLVAIAALSAVFAAALVGCATSSASSVSGSSSASASGSAASAAEAAASSAAKSSASASSAASSGVAAGQGRGDAEPTDLAKSQRFGNGKVGYVSVPSDWKDFTLKLDSRMVDSTSAVYIVDPTTEFTSGVESHFAYSSSIKLETYPCTYTEKADELLYKYRGEKDDYTTPSIEKGQFNGKNASIIACSSADNVDITNIVIEKDASSCILITAWGTRSNVEAVLGYVSTWSMSN